LCDRWEKRAWLGGTAASNGLQHPVVLLVAALRPHPRTSATVPWLGCAFRHFRDGSGADGYSVAQSIWSELTLERRCSSGADGRASVLRQDDKVRYRCQSDRRPITPEVPGCTKEPSRVAIHSSPPSPAAPLRGARLGTQGKNRSQAKCSEIGHMRESIAEPGVGTVGRTISPSVEMSGLGIGQFSRDDPAAPPKGPIGQIDSISGMLKNCNKILCFSHPRPRGFAAEAETVRNLAQDSHATILWLW